VLCSIRVIESGFSIGTATPGFFNLIDKAAHIEVRLVDKPDFSELADYYYYLFWVSVHSLLELVVVLFILFLV